MRGGARQPYGRASLEDERRRAWGHGDDGDGSGTCRGKRRGRAGDDGRGLGQRRLVGAQAGVVASDRRGLGAAAAGEEHGDEDRRRNARRDRRCEHSAGPGRGRGGGGRLAVGGGVEPLPSVDEDEGRLGRSPVRGGALDFGHAASGGLGGGARSRARRSTSPVGWAEGELAVGSLDYPRGTFCMQGRCWAVAPRCAVGAWQWAPPCAGAAERPRVMVCARTGAAPKFRVET